MVGLVKSWPVIVSKLCTKTSKEGSKTVKTVERGLNNFDARKDISIALS